jgi:hypothetical protein
VKPAALALTAVAFVAAVPALSAVGCAGCQNPVRPPVVVDGGAGGSVVVDAGPAPVDPDVCQVDNSDDCGRAGYVLCKLECRSPAGAPLWQTPGGKSFASVCRQAAADGRSWRPDCLARITECSQLDGAYRAKAGAACPL